MFEIIKEIVVEEPLVWYNIYARLLYYTEIKERKHGCKEKRSERACAA